MHKRHLVWAILAALVAVLASQFFARPELRAFVSPDYWKSLFRYGQVMRLVESRFVDAEEVGFGELTDAALTEAVRSLDAHSEYMLPEEYEEFNRAAKQEYTGVGIEVSHFSGRHIISKVIEGGAAAEAGVMEGDFIVGVEGKDVRDEPLSAVVDRIRGPAGTEVSIAFERISEGKTLGFELERRPLVLDSVVDVEMLSEAVGSVRIRQFTAAAVEELVAAMGELKERGMRALILDVRGNPGGRLDGAAAIAELFLEPGREIVKVRSRRGLEDVFEARERAGGFAGPLAVLIDGRSASASEIMAGALRDHSRAVLIGERTFGKGSVQSVYGFSGGFGLKLTSARYVLPDGRAINGEGVEPDIEASIDRDERMILMLQRHHLRRAEAEGFERRYGFPPVRDEPLELARELLEGALAGNEPVTAESR